MNNLLIRSISGTILVLVILSSIYFNKYTEFLGFGILFLFISIYSLLEFYNIIENDNTKPQKIIGILAGATIYTSIFAFTNSLLFNSFFAFIFCSIILVFIIFITEIYRKLSSPVSNIAATFMGIIYISIPLGLLNLFFLFQEYSLILMFFAIIWIYDTFAYLSGKFFGKHKLIERISPKKTIEGLIGGFIFALAFTFGMSFLFTEYTLIEWLIFGFLIILSSTFGDLTESLFKRSVNVKDSGNIIPGHGGLLDRFDSVFLASPIAISYIFILEYFK